MDQRPSPLEYHPPESTRYPRARDVRWDWICGALLLVVVVLVALNGRRLTDKFLFGGYTESLSRQQIERIGAMQLPASATRVRARVRSWQDTLLVVRFSLPPADVATFLGSTGIEQPLSTTELPANFEHANTPWWQPGHPKTFEAGEGEVVPTRRDPEDGYQWEESVRQHVLIDKSNPESYTVWFVSSRE